jgi:RNA polymerase sigma factor (sigma-70 family)
MELSAYAENTVELLAKARQGDHEALERLLQRTIPPLRRWARGRLPVAARGIDDTADLVQDSVFAALRHLQRFEARDQGALQAYLRQAVMNRIRDLVRKVRRRPMPVELPEQLTDHGKSPLQEAISRDHVAAYERAVRALNPADRAAIVARVELQYSYDDLAVALNKPSAAAARMMVTRAMKRLTARMQQDAARVSLAASR